jgi:hypothetical protein
MRPFPTVKQIKQALPFDLNIQYTGGIKDKIIEKDGGAYGIPLYSGGNLAPVLQTLALCDVNMCYYVCAVVKEHSWEPKYNTAGCKDWFISGWNVTLTRHSSQLGQRLLKLEFGQRVGFFGLDMLVVNIGGGPVPNCTSFAELACLVGYQLFRQHLEPRKYRLKHDLDSVKKFAQLERHKEALNQEVVTQQYFDGVRLSSLKHPEEVVDLEQQLLMAIEHETRALQNLRNEMVRLENEAREVAKFPSRAHFDADQQRKQQENEKKRISEEENTRREQERLQTEQEKRAKRKVQIESIRLEKWCQIRERELKLRQQHKQKYQQEMLQARYALLPTLDDTTRRFRGLAAFYPPSRDGFDTFVQHLKLLSVDCKRHLTSTSQQDTKGAWVDMLIQLKALKAKCIEIADTNDWLRPEEDEAWKDL